MGGRGSSGNAKNGWGSGVWSWKVGNNGAAFKSLNPGLQSSFESGLSTLFHQTKITSQTTELKPPRDMGFSKVVASKSGNAVIFSVKSGRKTLETTTSAQKAADAMAEAFIKKYRKS